MKLTAEEVNAALYAADPVRWPENFGFVFKRNGPHFRECTKEECLEYG